jgi:hypothetical protein
MYPHRIRLRGPWECEPVARAPSQPEHELPTPFQIALPCSWKDTLIGDFRGRVRLRRRFGYPGQIDATERVWFVLAGAEAVRGIWLNGQLLHESESEGAGWEFDVTQRLQARNEVCVEVEVPGAAGRPWEEAALEVRRTAYLRGVRAWVKRTADNPILHLAGEAAGTSERSLDLYGLIDGSTVIYATIEPAPEGRPFHLTSDRLPLLGPREEGVHRPRQVRVELVDGGVVWYGVEQTLPIE